MGKLAFVFAGQGAQRVSMGVSLSSASPAADAAIRMVDAVCEGALRTVMTEGPQELLDDTRLAQPSLFAVDVAAAYSLIERGIVPEAVAGFSLGEYAAHVVAETIDLGAASRLVRERAEHMAAVAAERPGKMAVLLRGTHADVISVCGDVSSVGVVEPVNFNAPGQVVISGEPAAVDAAVDLWKTRGFKSLPLATSGPFHSSLMRPAADRLRSSLDAAEWAPSRIPLYCNVDASILGAGSEAEVLYRQVFSPVLWEQTVRAMIEDGFDTFVECGPGGVLAGLLSRIDREIICHRVEDSESLEAAVEKLQERDEDE